MRSVLLYINALPNSAFAVAIATDVGGSGLCFLSIVWQLRLKPCSRISGRSGTGFRAFASAGHLADFQYEELKRLESQ
jgi:hypothetical protein